MSKDGLEALVLILSSESQTIIANLNSIFQVPGEPKNLHVELRTSFFVHRIDQD